MKIGDIFKHLKRMSISIIMMLLLTYGMATNNPWLNIWTIMLIVMGSTFIYQLYKGARSRSIVEANLRDASRARRGLILFEAPEKDVNEAKGKGGGETSMGTKMLIMLLAPLIIFYTSGYALRIIIPEIEPWQSYMIGFLLTIPVSTTLTFKMGVSPGTMTVTPKSYVVSERGVVFDQLGQTYILRFPLAELSVQKEKNLIEVEGKAEADIIPNRLKLFSKRVDQLNKILVKHIVTRDTQR